VGSARLAMLPWYVGTAHGEPGQGELGSASGGRAKRRAALVECGSFSGGWGQCQGAESRRAHHDRGKTEKAVIVNGRDGHDRNRGGEEMAAIVVGGGLFFLFYSFYLQLSAQVQLLSMCRLRDLLSMSQAEWAR